MFCIIREVTCFAMVCRYVIGCYGKGCDVIRCETMWRMLGDVVCSKQGRPCILLNQWCIVYNPPFFQKNYKFSYFQSIIVICLIFVFLRPLYFDYDAFMHHALRLQGAPGCTLSCISFLLLGLAYSLFLTLFTLPVRRLHPGLCPCLIRLVFNKTI